MKGTISSDDLNTLIGVVFLSFAVLLTIYVILDYFTRRYYAKKEDAYAEIIVKEILTTGNAYLFIPPGHLPRGTRARIKAKVMKRLDVEPTVKNYRFIDE